MVHLFFFLTYSVKYDVNFIEIICKSMPHRLNIRLVSFFVKFYFFAYFRKLVNITFYPDYCISFYFTSLFQISYSMY